MYINSALRNLVLPKILLCKSKLNPLKQTNKHPNRDYKFYYMYNYISVFKLHILLKKNYSKYNVSRLMTILRSQHSLNNLYGYI